MTMDAERHTVLPVMIDCASQSAVTFDALKNRVAQPVAVLVAVTGICPRPGEADAESF